MSAPSESPPPDLKTNLTDNTLRFIGEFVGRGREQEELRQRLLFSSETDPGLVTIVGAPGCGKSRLAIEVGRTLIHNFADGVYLADLSRINNSSLIWPQIARAVNVSDQNDNTLLAWVHDKSMLLIIDNFDHLLRSDEGANEVTVKYLTDILNVAPALKILVTSRQSLNAVSEQVFPLASLETPDMERVSLFRPLGDYPSIQLFTNIARRKMSNLQPTPADLESIAWMCYRLDGLPLFIIIVASHIRAVGSIHALKVRMQQSRFGFAGHITDLPRSQRTMLAPLDWAYEQLTADQQKVFRRLALFPASCSLAALQAICQDVSNTQVALDTLVDKSLVSFLNGPVLNSLRGNSNPQAGLRYTMLQTIREYALIQLKSNGEAPNAAT